MKSRDDFDELLDECLQDQEFQKEWEASENEWKMLRAIYDAREKAGISNKELLRKTGISRADINRLERGHGNRCLNKLNKIANGLGMKIVIDFVPLKN